MSEHREQRNQIFAAQGIDPNMPTMSSAEKTKADFGLEIPNEVVPLPSCGKTYAPDSHLHNCETVEIKSMTTREEDILTNKVFLKKGTVVSELVKSCLIDKTVDPASLLVGDRNALMVAIRITGYGHLYDAEIECSSCGVNSAQTFNLGELPIKRLKIDPVQPGMNMFEFKLPVSEHVARFKFLTGKDEEEVMATAERQKKLGMQPDSQAVSTQLIQSILSINGVEDKAKLAHYIRQSMRAKDSLALREYIKENEPGIDMQQEVICSACGHIEKVGMPIGVNFLWPGSGK